MSAELADIARANVDRAREKLRCTDVDIITADAAGYKVPNDVSVIFLFNPFGGLVPHEVEKQIRKSLSKSPRKLTILYAYPEKKGRNLLADWDWLTLMREFTSGNARTAPDKNFAVERIASLLQHSAG